MIKYHIQRMLAVLVTLLALASLPVEASAQEVLQRIPKNAIGFAIVQNLTEASEKFERLLEPFDVTFPAPLAFAKLVTGLDAGLDVSGELVIALLPGDGPKAATRPMVLLPITRYEEFAASINADASGEICRVTLLGEDILVARDGKFAMLMNVEHRETMEKLLTHAEEPIAALIPLANWLPKQDVALVLMTNGLEQLSNWQRPLTRRRPSVFEITEELSVLSQLLSTVSTTETFVWLHNNVELAAIGVSVDEKSNVRLGEQFVLKESSPLASLSAESIRQQTAKLGLSDKPFVFAAGGPIAPGWGKQLATYLRQFEQENADENGLENIPSGLWDKEERAYQLMLEDIRSCSVVMLTGEKGEPLVGNFLGVATVPDVSKYFDSLPQIIKTWNELTQQSTIDIKHDFELTIEEVAGKRRCEIVVDVATTMRDPNVPTINWMIEALFGLEGKLRIQLAQVDSKTFIFGLATPEQMTDLLATAQKNATAAPQRPALQATLETLKPTAPWKALVSPQGCLRWTSRFYNEFLVLLSDQEMKIPDIPDCPPVGITADWNDRRWECELVCPAQTWETLAEFLEAAKDL